MAMMNSCASFPALLPQLLIISLCLLGQYVSSETRGINKPRVARDLPAISPALALVLAEERRQQQQEKDEVKKTTPPSSTTVTPIEPQRYHAHGPAESLKTTSAPCVPGAATEHGLSESDRSAAARSGSPEETPAKCEEETSPETPTRPLTAATAMLLLVAIVLFVGLLHFKVGAEIRRLCCGNGTGTGGCAEWLSSVGVMKSDPLHRLKLVFSRAPAAGQPPCFWRKDKRDHVQSSTAQGQALVPVGIRMTYEEDSGRSSVIYAEQSQV